MLAAMADLRAVRYPLRSSARVGGGLAGAATGVKGAGAGLEEAISAGAATGLISEVVWAVAVLGETALGLAFGGGALASGLGFCLGFTSATTLGGGGDSAVGGEFWSCSWS